MAANPDMAAKSHATRTLFPHTRAPGMDGLQKTWLISGGNAWASMENLREGGVSLRVTGTNGLLPRKRLCEARIDEIVTGAVDRGVLIEVTLDSQAFSGEAI